MTVHIVTYATHSEGLFDKLVKNNHGVTVNVLGWNTKWNSFMDKFNGVIQYIDDNTSDDDLIVFVDGFDSLVNKPLDGIEEVFKSFDASAVFSHDTHRPRIANIVFTKCKNTELNSGMYMGYAKYIKDILTDSVQNYSCNDDQRVMTEVCELNNKIKIDTDQKLFKNTYQRDKSETDAYFISYPGAGVNKKNRVLRGIKEYSQFFFKYITVLILTLILVFPRYKNVLLTIYTLYILLLLGYAEKKCMRI